VRRPRLQFSVVVFAGAFLVLAGCAGGGTVTVKKTLDNPQYTDHSYSDILVIGVAGDYDNRAAFERAMVSRIKVESAAATAYYTVVGKNKPITRNTVSAVVKSRGFDAVLLTRVLSQSSVASVEGSTTDTKVSRMEADRVIDLFRYDYEQMTDPGDINILSTVTLSAEMFSGPDETRMWAIESTISNKENVGQIIEAAADTIMGQLKKDRLIGE
jgi:hypothetical protein